MESFGPCKFCDDGLVEVKTATGDIEFLDCMICLGQGGSVDIRDYLSQELLKDPMADYTGMNDKGWGLI